MRWILLLTLLLLSGCYYPYGYYGYAVYPYVASPGQKYLRSILTRHGHAFL
jgi:hypothetical protein